MTLCKIDGAHCNCQPDEGIPCQSESPDYQRGFNDAWQASRTTESQADAVAAIQNTPLTLDHKSNQEETNELITKTQRLLSLWSRPR